MSKADATQQQILDAAIQVFAQKGYHDTRVSDIVKASGTSKGSVYFHFPSKQDIFLSVIEKFANLLASGVKNAIDNETSGIRGVDAALRTCLDIFDRYKYLAKIFLVQASGLGKVFEEKKREINDSFAKVIKSHLDQAIEENELPPMDTEIAALAWIGALYEVVNRWVLTGSPDPERMLPALRMFLLRSIGIEEERIHQLDLEISR